MRPFNGVFGDRKGMSRIVVTHRDTFQKNQVATGLVGEKKTRTQTAGKNECGDEDVVRRASGWSVGSREPREGMNREP
jgi:hypothetical protein